MESAAALQMCRAAAAAAPNEACGLLFGRADSIIREASVAANVAADRRRRFEIDPAHLFEAHRRHRAGPDRLIGCWHSHPNADGTPSRHDRAGVSDMGWLWLIVASGKIHAWKPTADGFEPVALFVGSL